jgi:integrase
MRPFLALKLGLRSGEIAGLQWGDIDWSKKEIKIRRSVHYAKGNTRPEVKSTKTGKNRTLELSEPVITELKKYRTWVSEVLLKGGVRLKDDNHILFADDLGILHKSGPMTRWDTLLKNAGLRHRGIHSLRHTYVANLLMLGVNPKHIQYRLGHTNIETTMNTYGKILEKDKDEVARKIEQWDLKMES